VFLSVPELPCNVSVGIEKVMQIKLRDGTTTKFGGFHLHAKKGKSFTKVDIHSDSVDTDLISVSKVNVCGFLPLNQANTIEGFTYTGGGIKIVNDFTKTGSFYDSEPREHRKRDMIKRIASSVKENARAMRELRRSYKELAHLIKVPFADISDLNLNIVVAFDDPCSMRSRLANKFKDENLTIDAYRGEADTTIRDLIDSYTHIFANACLSTVADFIKHTATGEIASDAVNSIKGALDAGKRTRIAIKQELKHAAGGAIRTGEATTEKLAHGGDDMVDAAKRTHKAIKQAIRTVTVTTEKSAHVHEDMIYSAVGATSDTTEHISQLKGRIKKPFRNIRDLLKSSP
jgi:hypothetical protein